MQKSMRWWTVALLGAAVWGCDDFTAPLETEEANSDDLSPPTEVSTAEVPEQFSHPPSILNWSTDVGFSGSRAWAQAYMKFFANHAEQELTLDVRKDGSLVGRRRAHKKDSWYLPRFASQWLSTSIQVGSSCGHRAGAGARHIAWHKFVIDTKLTQWGHTIRSSGGDASQPACTSSCATQLVVEPGECDEGPTESSGGDTNHDGQTDDLTCTTEEIVLEVDGEVVYEGPAEVCE